LYNTIQRTVDKTLDKVTGKLIFNPVEMFVVFAHIDVVEYAAQRERKPKKPKL